MINLGFMSKVVKGLDEGWRFPFAEKMIEQWAYKDTPVWYFRGSANIIAVFKDNDQRKFLRFNKADEKAIESIESEMHLLKSLEGTSVNVVKPILSINNKYVELIETELGQMHVVLFEEAKGQSLDIDQMENSDFYKWGLKLGDLHSQMKEIDESIKSKRLSWTDHLQFAEELLSHKDLAIKNEIKDLRKHLSQLEMNENNYGLIHYDFELDNIKCLEGDFSIIDFDDACNYWFIADIVYALRDLILDGDLIRDERFDHFIKAYESKMIFNHDDLKNVSLFIRIHKLYQMARLTNALNFNKENQEQWLLDLSDKLQMRIDAIEGEIKNHWT